MWPRDLRIKDDPSGLCLKSLSFKHILALDEPARERSGPDVLKEYVTVGGTEEWNAAAD